MNKSRKISLILSLAVFISIAVSCGSQKQLPSACLKKPDAGNCKAAFHRYYYSPETKKCEMFIWGGCGGNVPFETMVECRKMCGRI